MRGMNSFKVVEALCKGEGRKGEGERMALIFTESGESGDCAVNSVQTERMQGPSAACAADVASQNSSLVSRWIALALERLSQCAVQRTEDTGAVSCVLDDEAVTFMAVGIQLHGGHLLCQSNLFRGR
jgi:hypothetical protein